MITHSLPTEGTPSLPTEGMRGLEQLDGTLRLYEGDQYTLICTSTGADPDNDIVWWLEDDCMQLYVLPDVRDGDMLSLGYDATESIADCDKQPELSTDVATWNNFRPDFSGYNNKCLRCNSGGIYDQYELDIWSKCMGKKYSGNTRKHKLITQILMQSF